MEEIAEAANVSSHTLFRYFDSKFDIVCPSGKSSDEGDEHEWSAAACSSPSVNQRAVCQR